MRYRSSRKVLAVPYAVFLLAFVAAPLCVLFYYAFTDSDGSFTFSNFINFFTNPNTTGTLCYSLAVAFVTTLVCLLIAYPVAYILAKSSLKNKAVWLLVFILPMWINFSLRMTALKEILDLIEGNLAYFQFLNTILGMTYDFLPFMILPIYNTLAGIDQSYIEAAKDLGAGSASAFLRITLPLSVPGIISGAAMVFLPSMTNYVILDMLYNSTYIMGSLIGSYFAAYDWNGGSMIALVMLLIISVFTLLAGTGQDEDKEGGYAL